MATSFSSRRLRNTLAAGWTAGLGLFLLQVTIPWHAKSGPENQETFSLSISDLRGPVLRDSSLSNFLSSFAGLVIGTISCFTRSLFSDDVGFVVCPRPDFS
jgi:hypothetical protein